MKSTNFPVDSCMTAPTWKASIATNSRRFSKQCDDRNKMAQRIVELTREYLGEGFASIGIICKSQKQANQLHALLKDQIPVHLMDINQKEIFSGVMLMPVYMAKGLEFDAAILCDVDDKNYRNDFDRQLLYVSCTRALHRLAILYTDKPSKYLKQRRLNSEIIGH